MQLLLGWYHYSVKKKQYSDAFMNALPTNQPTDKPTDTAYHRDARTHLKMNVVEIYFY